MQLRASTPREAFVKAREARDASLTPPRLLYPSVQVNVNAGRLPAGGARALGLFERAHHRREGYRDVDPQLVHARLGAVRIVDVREPPEFAGELGHPPGAELVPLGAIERTASTWLKDEEIVLVCRSGARSARAAMALAAMGFSRVMNMVGGMIAWNAQSLAVSR